MQQEAVELLVFHAVTALASCYCPVYEVCLAALHSALRLLGIQRRRLLADVRIDEVQPLVEIDITSPGIVDLCKQRHASLQLILWALEELCYSGRKTKAARHACSSVHHSIEISNGNQSIKVCIHLCEAFQQELVELPERCGAPALGGSFDEGDEALPAVFSRLEALQLLQMDVSCGWSRNAELDCLRDTIRIPSLVHATRQRWGHTREGWLKRLCLRADVCVTEVQPCFEVDVATCIMHLVEHRLAGRSLLFWAGVGGKCRRGKSKSPRSLCSNINECIKCGCINSAIAIFIGLGETM
mmetsp:Transcript_33181/g.59846  ORF Transcript_33181/g.59846 Transcript_33181/m.59846 type:complete len:299 (+) Transcript_33181:417-1313(+)